MGIFPHLHIYRDSIVCMYGLSVSELEILQKLHSPEKIQDFLDSMPTNNEKHGETCMSPVAVLRYKKAHCIEGAMLAALCLMLQGYKPLVLSLKVQSKDYDHVVALFKKNGYWGAISKTNHSVLRYRDPIYKTIRELALSYFHEYFLTTTGEKTMLGYTQPINLRRFGTKWITEEKNLWHIAEAIFDTPYISVVPKKNIALLRNASKLERTSAGIPLWKKTNPRT